MKTISALAILILGTTPLFAADTNVVSQARVKRLLVSNTQGEALGAMVLLNEIRAGRTNAALESLEFKIDNAIVLVSGQMDELDACGRESGTDFLKRMKAYRTENPRKIECEIYGSPEFRAVALQTIEKAKQILSGIKTESSQQAESTVPSKAAPSASSDVR